MSTRCNVIVKDCTIQNGVKKENWQVKLYHHHDGYPEGVGKDLTNFINKLEDDFYVEDVVNGLLKNEKDKGYKWCNSLHGDIEYLYTIEMIDWKKEDENKWVMDIVLSYQAVTGGFTDDLKFGESTILTCRHFDC